MKNVNSYKQNVCKLGLNILYQRKKQLNIDPVTCMLSMSLALKACRQWVKYVKTVNGQILRSPNISLHDTASICKALRRRNQICLFCWFFLSKSPYKAPWRLLIMKGEQHESTGSLSRFRGFTLARILKLRRGLSYMLYLKALKLKVDLNCFSNWDDTNILIRIRARLWICGRTIISLVAVNLGLVLCCNHFMAQCVYIYLFNKDFRIKCAHVVGSKSLRPHII